MSKHNQPNHGHDHSQAADHSAKSGKKIHHDWRFWTAIVLMLLAMGAYVLSLDEAVRPGGVDEPQVPMAAE
ncbi:hypothetical protein [Allorhodopirellula heiligendammensis]|uniref:Uncharacterized protein n=1 Tax=Allorhodopirellula heiligendammensis TaxID=2714739 RepID=A0A5C6C864_9BACT|nr:hypothetical protein [Allorhodopirellula heiligendammensis]TWU18949.1 hypothetical protein Poly21_11200 [Allorhodopirellula heiligendammensis]